MACCCVGEYCGCRVHPLCPRLSVEEHKLPRTVGTSAVVFTDESAQENVFIFIL